MRIRQMLDGFDRETTESDKGRKYRCWNRAHKETSSCGNAGVVIQRKTLSCEDIGLAHKGNTPSSAIKRYQQSHSNAQRNRQTRDKAPIELNKGSSYREYEACESEYLLVQLTKQLHNAELTINNAQSAYLRQIAKQQSK
jgi:hypothetical protein